MSSPQQLPAPALEYAGGGEAPKNSLNHTERASHFDEHRERGQDSELLQLDDEDMSYFEGIVTECPELGSSLNNKPSTEILKSPNIPSIDSTLSKPRRASKRLLEQSGPQARATAELPEMKGQSEDKRAKPDDQSSLQRDTSTTTEDQSYGNHLATAQEIFSESPQLSTTQEEISLAPDSMKKTTIGSVEASEENGTSDSENVTHFKDLEDTSEEVIVEGRTSDEQGTNEVKRSRLLSRISDDTDMLKDFISRARAKKAARALDDIIPTYSFVSPRRSPRKVLGNLDRNFPSPTKSISLADRPGTPPGRVTVKPLDDEGDLDESTSNTATHRRSARTRVPALPTASTPGPCFIPVRRPDGTELVTLQKSEAQELAVVTRANTRRNKGKARMPKYMLATLIGTDGDEELVARRQEAKHGKSVDWDERLVYYHESKEADTDKSEKPKIRRLRGSGTTNGTPAPKRMMLYDDDEVDRKKRVKGTPRATPKKRAKV